MDSTLKSRMAEFLDTGQVEELQSIPGEGELDLFADVANLFLRTTPELLENLKGAIEAGDAGAAAKHAHMLKGSSSNLGAFRLSEKSHQLEQGALRGEGDLGKFFEEISVDYAGLRAILTEVLAAPPS
jgi:HPt (histidine-containing phosphotransfer) domain-containing protein